MKLNFNPILSYLKKGSSWFLLGVLVLVLLNSMLAIWLVENQPSVPTSYNNQIQIIKKNVQGGFGNSYLANSDIGLVNLSSVQSLDIGKLYQIKAERYQYKLNDKLKPFDRYYRSLGIVAKLNIKSSKLVPDCSLGCTIFNQINIFQNWSLRSFGQTFCRDNYTILQIGGSSGCQDGYALSLGLIFGEDGYFSKELKTSFKKLGLTHLTAFSGMQTVLILSLVEIFLIKTKVQSNWRYLMAIAAMILIILIVGFTPPVIRSVLSMLISISVIKFFGRKLSAYRCLIYSGILMLILNPLYIINISFQLSFVATLGVILSGLLENKKLELNQLSKSIWNGFLQSGLCIIMTLPIILQLGSSNWLLTLLTNIIFVPILNFLTLFNYVLLIPYLNYILAPILVVIQTVITQFIIGIAHYAPEPNLVFNLQLWDYLLYYTAVGLICYFISSLSRVTQTRSL